MAEQRYGYIYALVDHTTNMCTDVWSTTVDEDAADFLPDILVVLEVKDPDYIGTYYINGVFYVDAAGTIPYISPLL